MNIKIISLVAVMAALGACSAEETPVQNPELLKGGEFVATQNGVDIKLNFDAETTRAYGKVVNNYNGSYEAAGNKIKFGPMMSTMMYGPENAMKVESEYFKFMGTVETYELAGSTLKIKDNDGKEIVFKKLETSADAPAGNQPDAIPLAD